MSAKKVCSRCEESRPIENFNRKKTGKMGRSAACKECTRAINAEYLSRPGKAEANRARAARRRSENPEYMRDYRAQNSEAISLQRAGYRRDNPHLYWESRYRVRARKFDHEVIVESFTRDELIETWGDECYLCGGSFEELDHVIPVHKGGIHSLANCRPCCRHCNRSKETGPKGLREWGGSSAVAQSG